MSQRFCYNTTIGAIFHGQNLFIWVFFNRKSSQSSLYATVPLVPFAPRHLSLVTRHPSPVTRHPSPVTCHPSPVTRHSKQSYVFSFDYFFNSLYNIWRVDTIFRHQFFRFTTFPKAIIDRHHLHWSGIMLR